MPDDEAFNLDDKRWHFDVTTGFPTAQAGSESDSARVNVMYVNLAFEVLAEFAGLTPSRTSALPPLEANQQAELTHSLDVWVNEGGGPGSDSA